MLDVALIGSGGMMPLPGRFLSGLALRYEGSMLLIDCGEGCQISLKMLGWGFKNIDCICLTHFHADHTAGLVGVLLAMAQSERIEPVTIIGPRGVKNVVKSLCIIAPEIPFQMNFIELDRSGVDEMKIDSSLLYLSALPVVHNAPCFAYKIDIKRTGKFSIENAEKLPIPRNFWGKLQQGQTIEHNGKIYTPDMVLGEARRGLRISYCTDSRPPRALPGFIKGSDLFICEGHYGENEKLEKAKSHHHMIFSEAAKLAKDGDVKELWLTHFSPAMPNPEYYLKNATSIFKNTIIGKDQMAKTFFFEGE